MSHTALERLESLLPNAPDRSADGASEGLPRSLKSDWISTRIAESSTRQVRRFGAEHARTTQILTIDLAATPYSHFTLTVDARTELTLCLDLKGCKTAAGVVVDLLVGPGAKVTFQRSVRDSASDAALFVRESITLKRDAQVDAVFANCSGTGQWRTEADLTEPGASFQSYGCVRADGDQNLDLWLNTLHSSGNTQSHLEVLTVAAERSRVTFNASINIPHGSNGVDAVQRNKNLLLSQKAIIDALPKLEILTDDVKCAHGSTVSSVSEDQLYYLQTRGIARADAETMIINGFTQPIIERFVQEDVRTQLEAEFTQKRGRDLA